MSSKTNVNREQTGRHKRKVQPKNEGKVVSSKMQKLGMEQMRPRPSYGTHEGLTDIKEDENCKITFCPNCQVPFASLTKDKNIKSCDVEQLHLNDCLDMDRRRLKECPQGISCGSTTPSHFYNFSHFQKAAMNAHCLDPICNNELQETEKLSETDLPYDGQDLDIMNKNEIMSISQASDNIFENSNSGCISEESEVSRSSPSLLQKETHSMPTNPEPDIPVCNNDDDSSGFCGVTNALALETICTLLESEKTSCAPAVSDARKIMSRDLTTVSPKRKMQTKLTSFFLGANGRKPTKLEFTSSECNRKQSQVKRISLQRKLGGEAALHDVPVVKSNNNAGTCNGERTCPFYKKIPGTKFAVDAFSYGRIPDIRHYFLSHFHYDHYQGLNKHFTFLIYCTKVTANLISLKIGVSRQYLFICPEDEPFIVDGVKIQLFDANHCPGSVMFLFSFLDGRNILHTGDFRATTHMMTHPFLSDIHTLYLDTTYLDAQYSFPSQDAVIKYVTGLVEKTLKRNPRTLFVCGSYTIGKERLFTAISKKSNLKIWASSSKHRILKCLEDNYLNANLITNWKQAQIHVLSMNLLNAKDLQKHLSQFEGIYTELMAIKPTGWTYRSSTANLADIRPQNSGSVAVYSVPYSEHSSFLELKQFVQALRPKKIIPTVKSKIGFSGMNVILKDWLKV